MTLKWDCCVAGEKFSEAEEGDKVLADECAA